MSDRRCLIASDEEDEDGNLTENVTGKSEIEFVPQGEVIYLPENTSHFQPEDESITDQYEVESVDRESGSSLRKRDHSEDGRISNKRVCATNSNQVNKVLILPIPMENQTEVVLGLADTPIVLSDEQEVVFNKNSLNKQGQNNQKHSVAIKKEINTGKTESRKYFNNLKAASLMPIAQKTNSSPFYGNKTAKYARQATPICDAIMKEYSRRQKQMKNRGQNAPDLSDLPIKELILKASEKSATKPEEIKKLAEQFTKKIEEKNKTGQSSKQVGKVIEEPNRDKTDVYPLLNDKELIVEYVDPLLPDTKQDDDIKPVFVSTISISDDIKPDITEQSFDLKPCVGETQPKADVKPIIVSKNSAIKEVTAQNPVQLLNQPRRRGRPQKVYPLASVNVAQPEMCVEPVIVNSFSISEEQIPSTQTERIEVKNEPCEEKSSQLRAYTDKKVPEQNKYNIIDISQGNDSSQESNSCTPIMTQTSDDEKLKRDHPLSDTKLMYVHIHRISEDFIRNMTRRANVNSLSQTQSKGNVKSILNTGDSGPPVTEEVTVRRKRGRPRKTTSTEHSQITRRSNKTVPLTSSELESTTEFKIETAISHKSIDSVNNDALNVAERLKVFANNIADNIVCNNEPGSDLDGETEKLLQTTQELLKLRKSTENVNKPLLFPKYQSQLISKIFPGVPEYPHNTDGEISTADENLSRSLAVQKKCSFIMDYFTSYQEVFDEKMFKDVMPLLSELLELCLKDLNEGILKIKFAEKIKSPRAKQKEINLIKQWYSSVILDHGKKFYSWFNTIVYKIAKTKTSKALLVTFIFFLSGSLPTQEPNCKEQIHRIRRMIMLISQVLKEKNPLILEVLNTSNDKYEDELRLIIQILKYFDRRKFVLVPENLLSYYTEEKFIVENRCSNELTLTSDIISESLNSSPVKSNNSPVTFCESVSSDRVDNDKTSSVNAPTSSKSVNQSRNLAEIAAQFIEALHSESQYHSKRIEEKLDHILNVLSGNLEALGSNCVSSKPSRGVDNRTSNCGSSSNVSLVYSPPTVKEDLPVVQLVENKVSLPSHSSEESQSILTKFLENDHAGLDSLFESYEKFIGSESVHVKSENLDIDDASDSHVSPQYQKPDDLNVRSSHFISVKEEPNQSEDCDVYSTSLR
ncbi:uncharacterized protein LOC124367296 [Homalodisca vitripennis]|uniref:uncharacterized protein LOC124367296 n=1 Tax=Homalodisca vitripennis TaxID=197043 RepID=UPI001EEC6799|nr:uncharacterized protein LOC124367296 [Homalodisca vitripennis]XP_046679973.1 uncharacterized protein LOC124367296 [Homalodisca vitripennis]